MESKKRNPNYIYYLIVVGMIAGLVLAIMLIILLGRIQLSEPVELWLAISLAGMFGGFLFGIRDRQLVAPHRNKNGTINPGWIADCAYGVGGAWIVFLVIPGTFGFTDGWEVIKVLATATVGGYGSRAIIAQALNETIKKLEERLDENIEENKEQQETDAKALAMVNRLLDPSHPTSEIDIPDLKENIKAAAPGFKVQIFYIAHAIRSENWETNKALMERTIPIFEALIESDTKGWFHRNHGQLGYALKDKVPADYARARAALTKAIELREKKGQPGFQLYELNRAICSIHLDSNFQRNKASTEADKQVILADLIACMNDSKTSTAIKASVADAAKSTRRSKEVAKNPIGKWMKVNGVTVEDLR